MIPYISLTTFHIGPVPIQVWGLFVALGILAGAAVNAWVAKQRGQEPGVLWDLAAWVAVAAFIGGRLFYAAFYDPRFFIEHPAELPMVWHGGMSVMGGFIGAALAGVWFLRRRKVDVWAYVDTGIMGLPIGLFIGRIGCFLIHDHPGTATHFILGVQYPDGVIRHDLGLYESLVGLAIAIVFAGMWIKKVSSRLYLPTFLLLYGTARFFLDFLRISGTAGADARYLGLTPAQYMAIGLIGFGVYLLSCRPKIDKRV